jgi:AcrR family transcriptional regulator
MQWHCIDAVTLHCVVSNVNPRAAAGLRQARTARTEAALVEAATALFVEQGYVATTLTQVAHRAGLAPRTVYVRFGTKAALFRRVVDTALVGDAEPIDVAHRPGTQVAMTAPTLAERLDAFVETATGIAARAGALFEVATQAEGLEPEIAQAAQAGREATARLCAEFWTAAVADGLLPAASDVASLARTTDVLVCADTLVHLRRTTVWSAANHAAWLHTTLTLLTAEPPAAPPPTPPRRRAPRGR